MTGQTIPGLPALSDRFDDVRRIAVLRGGGLGDLVFAFPAIAALRATYPDAEITLLGSPSHRALLGGRPSPVDAIEVLPVVPGVGDSSGTEVDDAATEAFVARMRERRFDLAVQVHGGGRNSNPFLLRLGARHTVGTRTPDAEPLERTIPYVYYQHEVLRGLEVVALAGAASTDAPVLVPTDDELARARELLARGDDDRPVVVVHPGATDPRRRWPAERFGELAARLVAQEARVVVVGDASDVEAAATILEVAGRASGRPDAVTSLADRIGLAELVGVLADADLVVADDSGPRHLAEALGTPTSAVFWFGNVINAGALGRTWHRIAMSYRTSCPVCGVDITQVGWTSERCEHDDSVVADVTLDEVWQNTSELLAAVPRGAAVAAC